jgi:mannose-6-phosphate isomerase class I
MTKKALNSNQFNTLKSTLENFEWFTQKPRTPTKRKTSKPRKKLTAEQAERKERWNIANKARKEAVANGLTEFMAVCGHHGETQYTLGSRGQARCMACMKENSVKYNSAKQTPEQKAKFERQTKNRGLMVAAVESGFMRFDGICDKHGISKFVINKKKKQYPNTYPFQYKCHKCKYEYAAELKKKRREVARAKQAMI